MTREVQVVYDEVWSLVEHIRQAGVGDASQPRAFYNGIAFKVLGSFIAFTGNKSCPISLYGGSGASKGPLFYQDFLNIFAACGHTPSAKFSETEQWFQDQQTQFENNVLHKTGETK